MRSWTFRRKINAAKTLDDLLTTSQTAGPPEAGQDGKAEFGDGTSEQEEGDGKKKGKGKGQGEQGDGESQSGQSYMQADADEEGTTPEFSKESGHGGVPDSLDEWKPGMPARFLDEAESGYQKWGEMEILVLPFDRKKNTRGSLAVPEGVMMRFPQRYCTDMSLFKRSQGHAWGSLLVDNSGSMSLPIEALHGFLRKVPAANIAVYSGRGCKGTLTIVALKGLCASDEKILNIKGQGGNEIDGPALRWLAQQPKPRVWVSDGQVCAYPNGMTKNLVTDAAKITKAHRILRVPDLDTALKLVQAGRGGVHA
jgi:hypothetical protein